MPIQSRSCLILLLGLALGASWARAGEEIRESRPGVRRGTNLLDSTALPKRSVLDRLTDGPGRSIQGPTIPGPVPPSTKTPEMDPKDERRLRQDLDRRRNWLLENAARLNSGETGTAGLERDRRRDTGRSATPDNIDRLLRATDRGSAGDRKAGGVDGEDPALAGLTEEGKEEAFRRGFRDGSDGERDESGKEAVPAGQVPGFDLPDFMPRSSLGAETETLRSRPEGTLFPDASELLAERQQESVTRARDEAFDQMLNDVGRDGTASDPLVSRATASRRDQFQNLLAGPSPLAGPPVKAPSLFDSPVGAPIPAARSGLPEGPARSAAPAFEASRPGASRPAPARIEPRPLIIPIPTRGF